MTDRKDDKCKVFDINKQITGEIIESCSHNAILAYLRSEKRKPFLLAMKKYGYRLRVVKLE